MWKKESPTPLRINRWMFCYCFGNGISLLIDAVKEYCLVDRLMSFSKWIRDDYVNDCGFFFSDKTKCGWSIDVSDNLQFYIIKSMDFFYRKFWCTLMVTRRLHCIEDRLMHVLHFVGALIQCRKLWLLQLQFKRRYSWRWELVTFWVNFF